MTNELPIVIIYTDGACDPNPGPGGWAAILKSGRHTKELTGGDPNTTNNRMELTAAVEALKSLKQPGRVRLFTDSIYLQKGITEWLPIWQASRWRTANKRRVANRDLWEPLVEQMAIHEIEWHWVKGHAADPLNRRADWLATRAIERAGKKDSPKPRDQSALL
ncbi:MAG: ribonuclease HI [Chloroflexi bacterium]|nr:ribonuclease HI [Chloroflexota bacterium]